jgi:hypothetical protein
VQGKHNVWMLLSKYHFYRQLHLNLTELRLASPWKAQHASTRVARVLMATVESLSSLTQAPTGMEALSLRHFG